MFFSVGWYRGVWLDYGRALEPYCLHVEANDMSMIVVLVYMAGSVIFFTRSVQTTETEVKWKLVDFVTRMSISSITLYELKRTFASIFVIIRERRLRYSLDSIVMGVS